MSGRSPENNWQDAIMGEIELGSFQAYMAMSFEHDMGINQLSLERMFEIDDLEEGEEPSEISPWGPWGDDPKNGRYLFDDRVWHDCPGCGDATFSEEALCCCCRDDHNEGGEADDI